MLRSSSKHWQALHAELAPSAGRLLESQAILGHTARIPPFESLAIMRSASGEVTFLKACPNSSDMHPTSAVFYIPFHSSRDGDGPVGAVDIITAWNPSNANTTKLWGMKGGQDSLFDPSSAEKKEKFVLGLVTPEYFGFLKTVKIATSALQTSTRAKLAAWVLKQMYEHLKSSEATTAFTTYETSPLMYHNASSAFPLPPYAGRSGPNWRMIIDIHISGLRYSDTLQAWFPVANLVCCCRDNAVKYIPYPFVEDVERELGNASR